MNFKLIDIKYDTVKNQLLDSLEIEWLVARLDLIHPIVSGNKLFKLYYFVEDAIATNKHILVTKGGAYSNHLVASAYYAQLNGLKSIGLVRGEKADHRSHTLKKCEEWGMQLAYFSREDYPQINEVNIHQYISFDKENCFFIPEGGYGIVGTKGASRIMDAISSLKPNYITTAVGTGCTLSGLLCNKKSNANIIAVPVLKGFHDLERNMNELLESKNPINFEVFDEYHFGGYAKKNEMLLQFMNTFYIENNIPTDFVYTGKMIYAIWDKINKGYFPKGSKIVSIHTGGLQGNLSLPKGTLVF
jgi:1-aminocyclopropane-1-carboxylate deaminase